MVKTTNYFDTFIEVAEDCPVQAAEIPPKRGTTPTAATTQFELLAEHPYQYTSDDVLFRVFLERNHVSTSELDKAREAFFAKGQPCFRASPLPQRYGWGVHFDSSGRIALYAVESNQYAKLVADDTVTHLKAMRRRRG